MSYPRVLLAFHSYEGQTAKVSDRIATGLEQAGVAVDLVDANDAPPPTGYDGVILGDSIHLMKHSQSLSRYASRHSDELQAVPLALFQVSLTSATDDEEHSTKAHELAQTFIAETDIDPDLVALMAGAVAYTKYGWVKRRMMRSLVVADISDAADMTVDHEYTDWDAVDHFATDIASMVLAD